MALNIKNEETVRLARELSEKTGESLTTAVTEALRERLARVDTDFQVAEVLELARQIRERMPAGYFDQDFDEMLYDDLGLPK